MVEEYISRDELLKLYVDGKYDTAEYHVPVPVIIQNIKDIPAADVRPVVHGKWETETLDSGKFWANYCSNCDYYLPYGLEWKPNYCPNCGCAMDGTE